MIKWGEFIKHDKALIKKRQELEYYRKAMTRIKNDDTINKFN